MKSFTLWVGFDEAGKATFSVPDGVTLDQFKEDPFAFLVDYQSKIVNNAEVELDDVDDLWESSDA